MNTFNFDPFGLQAESEKVFGERPTLLEVFKGILADNDISYRRCLVSKDRYDEFKDEYKVFFNNMEEVERCHEIFRKLEIGFFGYNDMVVVRSPVLKKFLRRIGEGEEVDKFMEMI